MKRLVLLSLSIAFAVNAYAQKISESEVPKGIMETYKTKVTDSLPAVWEKSGQNYTARFSKNDLKARVVITENSEWVMTRWEIPAQYLPKKVREYLAANYPKYKVNTTEIEYKPGGEFYLTGVKLKKEVATLRFTLKSDFVGVEPQVPVSKSSK